MCIIDDVIGTVVIVLVRVMDQKIHENTGIAWNLGQRNKGIIENSSRSSGNPSNFGNGKTVSVGGDAGGLNENISSLQSSQGVVNQEMNYEQGIGQSLSEGIRGNSSSLVNEVVIVINSGEIVRINGDTKDLGASMEVLGLRDGAKIQDANSGRGNVESLPQVELGTNGDSSNSVNGVVLETLIMMNLQQNVGIGGENGVLEAKSIDLGSSTANMDKSKTKVPKRGNPSCVVDLKGVGGPGAEGGGGLKDNFDGERVCRICHLNSEGSLEPTTSTTISSTASMDLIQLGCGCKDELGIAHASCAEVWFKLKGNRICEICGETARNVTNVVDNRCLERRFILSSNVSSERNGGCWRGQPFCNFLMACLVVAFVLPWFFRVNMF